MIDIDEDEDDVKTVDRCPQITQISEAERNEWTRSIMTLPHLEDFGADDLIKRDQMMVQITQALELKKKREEETICLIDDD